MITVAGYGNGALDSRSRRSNLREGQSSLLRFRYLGFNDSATTSTRTQNQTFRVGPDGKLGDLRCGESRAGSQSYVTKNSGGDSTST